MRSRLFSTIVPKSLPFLQIRPYHVEAQTVPDLLRSSVETFKEIISDPSGMRDPKDISKYLVSLALKEDEEEYNKLCEQFRFSQQYLYFKDAFTNNVEADNFSQTLFLLLGSYQNTNKLVIYPDPELREEGVLRDMSPHFDIAIDYLGRHFRPNIFTLAMFDSDGKAKTYMLYNDRILNELSANNCKLLEQEFVSDGIILPIISYVGVGTPTINFNFSMEMMKDHDYLPGTKEALESIRSIVATLATKNISEFPEFTLMPGDLLVSLNITHGRKDVEEGGKRTFSFSGSREIPADTITDTIAKRVQTKIRQFE